MLQYLSFVYEFLPFGKHCFFGDHLRVVGVFSLSRPYIFCSAPPRTATVALLLPLSGSCSHSCIVFDWIVRCSGTISGILPSCAIVLESTSPTIGCHLLHFYQLTEMLSGMQTRLSYLCSSELLLDTFSCHLMLRGTRQQWDLSGSWMWRYW